MHDYISANRNEGCPDYDQHPAMMGQKLLRSSPYGSLNNPRSSPVTAAMVFAVASGE